MIPAAVVVSSILTPLTNAQEEKASYTHITNVTIFDGINEKTTEGFCSDRGKSD